MTSVRIVSVVLAYDNKPAISSKVTIINFNEYRGTAKLKIIRSWVILRNINRGMFLTF